MTLISKSYAEPLIKSLTLITTQQSGSSFSTNSLSIDLSVPGLHDRNLINNTRIRIAIANTPQSAKALDFVCQRTNEYKRDIQKTINSYDYSRFIRESLGKDHSYYSPNAPFSPFSINMPMMRLLKLDRIAQTGNNNSKSQLPPGTTVYDIPLAEQVFRDSKGEMILSTKQRPAVAIEPINLILPSESDPTIQLSCYIFVYAPLQVDSSLYDGLDAMSIMTDMSPVATMVPTGTKTMYVAASQATPFVGKKIAKTLKSPDRDNNFITENGTKKDIFQQKLSLVASALQGLESKQFTEKNTPSEKVIKKTNYFSDLWLSKDHKENHRFLFSFNLRSFLAKKSPYSFLYKNEKTFIELQGFAATDSGQPKPEVKEVEIYRRFAEDNQYGIVSDSLSSLENIPKKTDSNFPCVVLETPTELQIDMREAASAPGLLFYQGLDDFSTPLGVDRQTSGKFLYGVNLSVYDAAPQYIKQKLNFIDAAIRDLETITEQLMGTSYNPRTGFLLESIKTVEVDLGHDEASVYKILEEQLRSLEPFLESITGIKNIELVSALEQESKKNDGKVSYKMFLSVLELYYKLFHMTEKIIKKQFSKSPNRTYPDIRRKQIEQNSASTSYTSLLSCSHMFSGVYERGQNFGFGADYFFSKDPASSPGLNSATVAEYRNRQKEEFQKYFSAPTSGFTLTLGGPYSEPSCAYFAAKAIMTPGKEKLIQTDYSDQGSACINLPMNRYAELFSDIIQHRISQTNKGGLHEDINKNSAPSNISGFLSQGAKSILVENFGVEFPKESPRSFKVPVPTKGNSLVTIVSPGDALGCRVPADMGLIPAIVGGADSQATIVTEALEDINLNIRNLFPGRTKDSTSTLSGQEQTRLGAVKLPFLIMGELAIDGDLDIDHSYNSLTDLKNFFNIAANDVSGFLESSYVSRFPNQVKSMLAFAATNEDSALGGASGLASFDARRPKLNIKTSHNKEKDSISYYGDLNNIPPFPVTPDPMRSTAQFLAFWMNYKQISVIEYLHSFGTTTGDNHYKAKLSNWRKLDTETLTYMEESKNKRLVCRIRNLAPQDYLDMAGENLEETQKAALATYFEPKESLSLPIYNEYFYLESQTTGTGAPGT